MDLGAGRGRAFGVERVRGFGGELKLATGDTGGTSIDIVIPAPDPAASDTELQVARG